MESPRTGGVPVWAAEPEPPSSGGRSCAGQVGALIPSILQP